MKVIWTPDTIIALVLVVGCLLLIAFGIDSEVKFILGMSGGWAFGAQYQSRRVYHDPIKSCEETLRRAGYTEKYIADVISKVRLK